MHQLNTAVEAYLKQPHSLRELEDHYALMTRQMTPDQVTELETGTITDEERLENWFIDGRLMVLEEIRRRPQTNGRRHGRWGRSTEH